MRPCNSCSVGGRRQVRANPSARVATRDAETTIFVGRLGVLLADQAEETEQGRPEHEEMQQRLPQKRKLQGVYQIGDV